MNNIAEEAQEMMNSKVSFEWIARELTIQAREEGALEPREYFIVEDAKVEDDGLLVIFQIHKERLN